MPGVHGLPHGRPRDAMLKKDIVTFPQQEPWVRVRVWFKNIFRLDNSATTSALEFHCLNTAYDSRRLLTKTRLNQWAPAPYIPSILPKSLTEESSIMILCGLQLFFFA